MKRALITDLHAAAQTRKPGYLEACFKLGQLSADGQWLTFTPADHAALRRQYSPQTMPGLPAMFHHALAAGKRILKAKLKRQKVLATENQIKQRQEICRGCGFFDQQKTRCAICGCHAGGLIGKWKWRTEHCPLPEPKW